MSLPTALSDLFDKKFHPGAAESAGDSLRVSWKWESSQAASTFYPFTFKSSIGKVSSQWGKLSKESSWSKQGAYYHIEIERSKRSEYIDKPLPASARIDREGRGESNIP